MKNSAVAVGLDIGTTKIVVMVGRRKADGTVEIIGMGQSPSTGVSKGAIQNISKTIAGIREAVSQAEQTSGRKIEEVTVGIAGQYIRSVRQTDYITRENPHRVIDQADIDRLTQRVLKTPLSQHESIIHVLPQEYKVDSEAGIAEPVGMFGQRLEATFHVVIGQIAPLLNVRRCVEGAGLRLSGLQLEPIASAEAALTDEEKEAGVILVDIGGGTTDLVILRDNLVRYSAVIPYGGKVVTSDIKEACAILDRYAEKLKTEYGSTWPGANLDTDIVSIPVLQGLPPKEISMKTLSRVIYARMDEILDDINAEIANYRQIEPYKNLIGGIVITGGGSLLRHLPELVSFKAQMNCRVGYPNIYLSEENSECITSPAYATCVGLVVGGLKDAAAGEEPEEDMPGTMLSIEPEPEQIPEVELPLERIVSQSPVSSPEDVPVYVLPERDIPEPVENTEAKTVEDPYSYPQDETLGMFSRVEITVEKEPEDLQTGQSDIASPPVDEKQAAVPEKQPKIKEKMGWDKKIERKILDFLGKIE